MGLLGESGSGKTTLARCIAGLQRPDSGTITYKGTSIFPRTENRKRIGVGIQMLFQASGASLDPCLTMMDSLLEGISCSTRDPKAAVAAAEEWVSSVGMTRDCLGRLPSQLSGGQRQRIALARALSAGPRLLLLDEPTSAVDALTSAQLLRLLRSLQAKRGFSLLLITHHVQTALSFCDRVAVLRDGVIVEEAASDVLCKHPRHDYTQLLFKESGMNSDF